MTQTYGSPAKVKWEKKPDRLNPERTDKDVLRILGLLVEVRRLWEEAVDVGIYGSRGEQMTLGRGFSESNPTEGTALAPTKRQARDAAKRAATLIGYARDTLQEASDVLHHGLLRTDPEVLTRFLEKRAAALDGEELHP